VSLPLITDSGTFIIHGAERVIVSQLHRSHGACSSTAHPPNGKLPLLPRASSRTRLVGGVQSRRQTTVMHVHIDRNASCRSRCCCARWASSPTARSSSCSTPGKETLAR